jgi:hypothetical protein
MEDSEQEVHQTDLVAGEPTAALLELNSYNKTSEVQRGISAQHQLLQIDPAINLALNPATD